MQAELRHLRITTCDNTWTAFVRSMLDIFSMMCLIAGNIVWTSASDKSHEISHFCSFLHVHDPPVQFYNVRA